MAQLPELEAIERKGAPNAELPELLEGETENQSAVAMDRISTRRQRERGATRIRRTFIGVAALALAAWAAWQTFVD